MFKTAAQQLNLSKDVRGLYRCAVVNVSFAVAVRCLSYKQVVARFLVLLGQCKQERADQSHRRTRIFFREAWEF